MDAMAGEQEPPGSAREAVDRLVRAGFLDDLMSQVDQGGVQLSGEGGFLPELVKRVLEAGLQAESSRLSCRSHTGCSCGVRAA